VTNQCMRNSFIVTRLKDEIWRDASSLETFSTEICKKANHLQK